MCVFRALTLTTTPQGNESSLASLAVCAGFDFVEYSAAGHVRVYVKTQDGYRAHAVEFLEGFFFFLRLILLLLLLLLLMMIRFTKTRKRMVPFLCYICTCPSPISHR